MNIDILDYNVFNSLDPQDLEKYLSNIRRLIVSPPIKTVTLRRDIANTMIQYGRYFL